MTAVVRRIRCWAVLRDVYRQEQPAEYDVYSGVQEIVIGGDMSRAEYEQALDDAKK